MQTIKFDDFMKGNFEVTDDKSVTQKALDIMTNIIMVTGFIVFGIDVFHFLFHILGDVFSAYYPMPLEPILR